MDKDRSCLCVHQFPQLTNQFLFVSSQYTTTTTTTLGSGVAGVPGGVTKSRPRTVPSSSLLLSGALQQLPLAPGEVAAFLASKEHAHAGDRDQQRQPSAAVSSSHQRSATPTLSGGHLRPASSPTYNNTPNATLASNRPSSSPLHNSTRPYASSLRPPPSGSTRPASHSSRGCVTRKGPVSDPVLEDMRYDRPSTDPTRPLIDVPSLL